MGVGLSRTPAPRAKEGQEGQEYNDGSTKCPVHAVRTGKDHTIYALAAGLVKFNKKRMPNFIGKLQMRTFVSVVPAVAKA